MCATHTVVLDHLVVDLTPLLLLDGREQLLGLAVTVYDPVDGTQLHQEQVTWPTRHLTVGHQPVLPFG